MTRVLVVDDEPQIVRALRINLRARHYDVDTALTGADALQRAAQHPPDVVILDLGLPDSRGHETFVAARATASHIPIIVLTGLGDEELAIRTVQEGAQDYLVKGQADASVLERSIRYAIERHRIDDIRLTGDQLDAEALWDCEGRLLVAGRERRDRIPVCAIPTKLGRDLARRGTLAGVDRCRPRWLGRPAEPPTRRASAAARRIAQAYGQWGRGQHSAALNFGDCFAYEVAKEHACRLLFVGDDFSKTDIEGVLSNSR